MHLDVLICSTIFVSLFLPHPIQGVVTAAVSLIACLCKKNPDDFKTCVSLAVSRLSRVSLEWIG